MTYKREQIKAALAEMLLKLGGEAPVGKAGLDWAVDQTLDIVEHRNNVPPLRDRVLINVEGIDDGVEEDYDGERRRAEVVDKLADANVITSKEAAYANGGEESDFHKIVLDLDVPATLVPSSTGGHFHLYIDYDLHWDDYVELLEVLAKIELVEEGYVEASKREGYTSARLPWVRKADK